MNSAIDGIILRLFRSTSTTLSLKLNNNDVIEINSYGFVNTIESFSSGNHDELNTWLRSDIVFSRATNMVRLLSHAEMKWNFLEYFHKTVTNVCQMSGRLAFKV